MPEYVDLRPGQLKPWPDLNPRRRFPVERVRELASSIAEDGVLQNLIVQDADETPDGLYHIVAGDTRWRAATLAEQGCPEISLDPVGEVRIPCRVMRLTEGQALKLAMLENVQRGALTAVEEARGFARLIELNGWTQGRLAEEMLGDATRQPYVANRLRLLELPELYLELIEEGHLHHSLARDHVLPLLRIDEDQRAPALDRLAVRIHRQVDASEQVHGPWLTAVVQEITAAVAQEFGHPTLFAPEELTPAAAGMRNLRQGSGVGAGTEAPAEVVEEELTAPQRPTTPAEEPPPTPARTPPAAQAAAPAMAPPAAAPPSAPAPTKAPTPAAPAAAPVATLPPHGMKREAVPEGAGFVTAVLTATGRRPTTIAITPLPDGRVVFTVAPRPGKAGETPLAKTGAPAELDAALISIIDNHFNV